MRVLVLHNPRAGDRRVPKADLVRALKRAGHSVWYRSLRRSGWKRALSKRVDVIIAAGGDGAVAKVALALVKRRRSTVPLSVIPTGTANNIARTLGITGSIGRLAAGLETAGRSRLAVGTAKGPWGSKRFVESAGIGLIASLIARDPETPRGGFAHLRRALRTAEPRDTSVRLDGREVRGRYLMIQVMNISAIGPRLELARHADPTDERLEVVLLGALQVGAFKRYLDALARGRRARCPLVAMRARRVTIRHWPVPRGGHLDDDLWPKKRGTRSGGVTIRVERSITVLVPR